MLLAEEFMTIGDLLGTETPIPQQLPVKQRQLHMTRREPCLSRFIPTPR